MTVQNETWCNIAGEERREKQRPNLALDTLDSVIEQVCNGLKQRESDPQQLRSLTSFPQFRLAGENASWYEMRMTHTKSEMKWKSSSEFRQEGPLRHIAYGNWLVK